MFGKKRKKNIHMDFASTTPVDKNVYNKMRKFFSENFFNPSSIYLSAKKVKDTLENYRKEIAKNLHIKSSEIFFTNGGTESINMAILGLVKKNKNTHIISSVIEHPAVLESLEEAKRLGAEITLLNVNENGLVSISDIENSLKENTTLITIGYVNSEIGTIQPISKIARKILKYKESLGRSREEFPYFHSDASQAGLYLDLNVDKLKVDMMTLDGSKIYGPKSSGVLIKKSYVELEPIFFGGGQEGGLRSGTENVPSIVGLCEALLLTFKRKRGDEKHFENLQIYFIEELNKKIPEAKINGSIKSRIKNNINICIEGINSEFVVIQMDEKGINCAAMTACKSLKGNGQSYVIESVSGNQCAGSSIRFSFGRETTKKDIDKTIKALKETVDFQISKE